MAPGRAFYAGLLEALTRVMGTAKGYLRDHGPTVATVGAQLGGEMGLSRSECAEIFFAAVLSDVGMIGLAEDAWENPAPELTGEIRARVQRHPQRAERRVRGIPHLEELAPLVRHHHEWWDGSGYPDGLVGEEIPPGAQIIRIADTVTALREKRPHRPALRPDSIADIVQASVTREFGPVTGKLYLTLHRSGALADYDHETHRHAVLLAADSLLPEEVSPPATEQLLGTFADVIDAKDPYTSGHSRRVAALAVAVAEQLGLEGHTRQSLWAGAHLHDLGKLAVPLRVLAKTEGLTEDDLAHVRAHPNEGAEILESIPTLRHLAVGVRHHHERWDGGGYPEGLSGERIPLVAQVMAVCDAYDAMTSQRAHREARSPADGREEVARASGTHFAPEAAEAFLAVSQDVLQEIHARRSPEEPALARVRSLQAMDANRLAGLGTG